MNRTDRMFARQHRHIYWKQANREQREHDRVWLGIAGLIGLLIVLIPWAFLVSARIQTP